MTLPARPTIVYAGLFRFPEGDAAGAHLVSVGKALRECGFQVVFAGAEGGGRPEDERSPGEFYYDGFRYFPQNEVRTSELTPLGRLKRYFNAGAKTLSWLEGYANREVAALVVYGGMTGYHSRLQPFCRKARIPLISHAVEWFDPGNCVGGRFGPVRLDVELAMRFWLPRSQNIICISSSLEAHFAKRRCNVTRLPPLINLEDQRWRLDGLGGEGREKFRLLFVGTPHRERWDVILKSLYKARERGAAIQLEILGSDRETWLSKLGQSRSLLCGAEDAVHVHGRVQRNEVYRIVAGADAAIIIRDDARWSRCCFPMKVPELLALGVPIIYSKVGDLSFYLEDGYNAFEISSPDVDQLTRCLFRAWLAKKAGFGQMRVRARESAKRFDYRRHAGPLREFLHRAVVKGPEESCRNG